LLPLFASRIRAESVGTVPELGWAGVQNGELLRRAADQLDVLISCDQSVPCHCR
jgi:hypothetical protein